MYLHIACGTPGCQWYSFHEDFILNGAALLRSLGHASDMDFEGIPETERKSFAGEGWALPCSSIVMLAYYANPWAPWWAGNAGSSNVSP